MRGRPASEVSCSGKTVLCKVSALHVVKASGGVEPDPGRTSGPLGRPVAQRHPGCSPDDYGLDTPPAQDKRRRPVLRTRPPSCLKGKLRDVPVPYAFAGLRLGMAAHFARARCRRRPRHLDDSGPDPCHSGPVLRRSRSLLRPCPEDTESWRMDCRLGAVLPVVNPHLVHVDVIDLYRWLFGPVECAVGVAYGMGGPVEIPFRGGGVGVPAFL